MILIDTSAWVEFLRATGSPTDEVVNRLIDEEIATCDAVMMELLAGARNERHLVELRGLLARAVTLPMSPAHYDHAASLYRTCRASGETVGKMIDCLIGAVAIAHDAEVLHADIDFAVLARHTALRVHPDSAG